MEEIQVLGNRWTRHELHARILPERNLISDLISGSDGVYVEIEESEYAAFLEHCKEHLIAAN